MWTQMGMGSAQAISAAWLTAKMEDHKRPVALAAYVMSIQLANFPGNQLFRTQGTSLCRYGRFLKLTRDRCAAVQTWTHNRCFMHNCRVSSHLDMESTISAV